MLNKCVSGWGVVRVHPWRLAGIYPTQAEADRRRNKLGGRYIVRHGDGFPQTGDFFWASQDE